MITGTFQGQRRRIVLSGSRRAVRPSLAASQQSARLLCISGLFNPTIYLAFLSHAAASHLHTVVEVAQFSGQDRFGTSGVRRPYGNDEKGIP